MDLFLDTLPAEFLCMTSTAAASEVANYLDNLFGDSQ